ncbi:MAG: hypothetical protein HC910_01340 [Spirulinaceae cyanobacterium SM2_1_0]|nr:hypothetical protein [Spirulinaceae cyanobacterium SM2_1_0]
MPARRLSWRRNRGGDDRRLGLMVQALSAAAKRGDPQAIAALLNKSLAAHNIAVKVLRQGDRLNLLVEAVNLPDREAIARFLKNSLAHLQPENIAVVSVQGRVVGQAQPAWHLAFRLNLTLPAAAPASTQSVPKHLATAADAGAELNNSLIVKHPGGRSIRYRAKPTQRRLALRLIDPLSSRNGERVGLIVLTFLLTSVLWSLLGIGGGTPSGARLSFGSLTSGSRALRGSLTLIDVDIADADDQCYGTGSYDDIAGNLRVVVRDGRNQILTTGETAAGARPNNPQEAVDHCVFAFRLDVPKADFYTIAIGRRGQLSYSWQELQERRWRINFTLDP